LQQAGAGCFSSRGSQPREFDRDRPVFLLVPVKVKTVVTSGKSLLFITRIPPMRGGGGSGVYSCDVLSGLAAQGFDVYVLLLEPCLLLGQLPWVWEQEPGAPFRRLCPGYCKIGRRLWNLKGIVRSIRNKLSRWLKFLRLPPAADAAWGNELTLEEEKWVRAARSQKNWAAVICNYCWLSRSLDLFGSKVRKAVLTHDVWHQHIARQSGNVHFHKLNRAAEQKYLDKADIVIAINERDAAIFQEMLPGKKVVRAPMSCSPHFSDQLPTSGRLLFIGSDYQPNIEGVTWFLKEVGPILDRSAPGGFTLNLVGAVGLVENEYPRSLSWVARGKVEELAPEYVDAEIIVIPLLAGTGLKIKLVEALAHGKAIVTTSVGAQGLENISGSGFLVADTAEEFAAAVLKISRDPQERKRLELAARKIALSVLSPSSCYSNLGQSLTSNKAEANLSSHES
jgi:glycosyltransferase involved in cell wall biosynthesis